MSTKLKRKNSLTKENSLHRQVSFQNEVAFAQHTCLKKSSKNQLSGQVSFKLNDEIEDRSNSDSEERWVLKFYQNLGSF
jgi:hypothetical protein